MGGSKAMHYGLGGLQTAVGAAATVFGAPEIGIPLMTSGIGGLAGQGAGGSKGFGMGESIGAVAGGLGEGAMGMGPLGGMFGGPFGPGRATSALQQMAQGAPPPASVVGGGTFGGPVSAADQQLLQSQAADLLAQEQPGGVFAPASGSSGGIMDFLKSPGGGQLAGSALQALGQPQPQPQIPGMPPKPVPPTLQPQPMPQPTVAKVPQATGIPGAGGAGGLSPFEQLALLRMGGMRGGL